MTSEPPNTPTDSDLIAAFNRGDHEAFRALYLRHRDWVGSVALRFCGNESDALDVLQETFAYLIRRAPTLTLHARLTTFLYPVIRNISLALIRRRGRTSHSLETLDHLLARPDPSTPDLDPIRRAIAALGDTHAEIILLRYVDDLSLEEIALALSLPIGTVKSRLHHAQAKLRADPVLSRYFNADGPADPNSGPAEKI